MNLNGNGRIKGAVLLGLASILWMFGPKVPLDRYFSPAPQASDAPVNAFIDDSIASNSTREVASSVNSNLVDLSTPLPKDVDRSTSKVIRECLPEVSRKFTANAFSLKDVVDDLRDSRTASTSVEVQNLHLKTAEGKELRLMISPSDSSEYQGLEAQLFSVDREGLPVIEELPLSLESRDIESARSHFLNQGTLIFSETTFVLKDEANKIAGKLSYSFDELTGAELSQNGRFLGCSKSISTKSIACKCL